MPADVAAADLFGDLPAHRHRLFEAEHAVVRGAVPARVREYTTVRWAAAQCMRCLGRAPAPLLPGHLGAPRWPDGLVGSLTHCRGYRAAVVAPASAVSGLGIDAEPDEPLPEGLIRRIASAGELRHLAALRTGRAEVRWDRLLFCAKEAFYKVWSYAVGTWLDFHDAEVRFEGTRPDARGGGFVVRLSGTAGTPGGSAGARRRPEPEADGFPALPGRWLARRGVLVTAIVTAVGELPGG